MSSCYGIERTRATPAIGAGARADLFDIRSSSCLPCWKTYGRLIGCGPPAAVRRLGPPCGSRATTVQRVARARAPDPRRPTGIAGVRLQ
jgi:hypothetical protein